MADFLVSTRFIIDSPLSVYCLSFTEIDAVPFVFWCAGVDLFSCS